jgi:hypothetical protein
VERLLVIFFYGCTAQSGERLVMRNLAVIFPLLLAGCNSGGPSCDGADVVSVVNEIAMRNNNSLYAAAKAALPSAGDQAVWSNLDSEAKQIQSKIQSAKIRCGNSSMVCEDMSMTPTLEAFRKINYNGSRPMAPAEVEYYSVNFLPLFDQLRSLQDKRKSVQEELRSKEATQVSEFDKSVRYELGVIRPQQRNEQTGSIACDARLSIFASTGSWRRDVFYTAERTTDGKVFVKLQRSN